MAHHASSMEARDRAWAEVADLLDLQLSPLGLAAMDALAPRAGETIMDIGCGAGQTLGQLAERVGPSGRVIGVDIAPMVLAIARLRFAGDDRVRLVLADASALTLPEESVDGVYSRLGVMALAEPVAAFANFRRATRRGGRLGFVCWRSLEENELDLLPLVAADLGLSIDRTPFKLERRDYLAHVLRSAGYERIEIEPFDASVSSGDADAMITVLTKVGPLGKLLRETPELRARAEPRVRAALAARTAGGAVSLTAATWIVTAVR